jgi:hypothetical protein
MIRHSVIFTLHHPPHSPQETEFLRAAECLRKIPEVANFEILRQVSPKNSFSFGFSMDLLDSSAFQNYLNHRIHSEFIASRWIPEVKAFLEIDFEPVPIPVPCEPLAYISGV